MTAKKALSELTEHKFPAEFLGVDLWLAAIDSYCQSLSSGASHPSSISLLTLCCQLNVFRDFCPSDVGGCGGMWQATAAPCLLPGGSIYKYCPRSSQEETKSNAKSLMGCACGLSALCTTVAVAPKAFH